VDRLIAAGADPTATNDDGKTAADVAAAGSHDAIAARLS
jgi:ankyrin repeat protein